MRLGYDASGINGAFQVAGDNGIEVTVFPFLTHLTGLPDTVLIEFSLRLSLHDLTGVIHRFSVSD